MRVDMPPKTSNHGDMNTCKSVRLALLAVLTLAILSFQIYLSLTELIKVPRDDARYTSLPTHRRGPPPSPPQLMAACLMVHSDNDILYEWIAYHYTVLPLRFLVIGNDVDNPEDPATVLHLWNNTDLRYWIRPVKPNDQSTDAHHALIHRQKLFVSDCLRFLSVQGVHAMTLLIDTDEYVQPHNTDPSVPVASLLPHTPCLVLPRLLVGALENDTCSPRQQEFANLTTVRFHQTSRKGDFAANKFGKAIVQVPVVNFTIRSIHRPFSSCNHAVGLPWDTTNLSILHYINSWERYQSRRDERRSRADWESRALVVSEDFVDCSMDSWIERFLAIVGRERGSELLHVHQWPN